MTVKGLARLGSLWLALIMGISACTSVQYQAERLDEHIGKATKQEIALFFGEPRETRGIEGGGEEWIYRYSYTTHGGTAAVGRRTCWESVLTFDRDGILREQARRDCKKTR